MKYLSRRSSAQFLRHAYAQYNSNNMIILVFVKPVVNVVRCNILIETSLFCRNENFTILLYKFIIYKIQVIDEFFINSWNFVVCINKYFIVIMNYCI